MELEGKLILILSSVIFALLLIDIIIIIMAKRKNKTYGTLCIYKCDNSHYMFFEANTPIEVIAKNRRITVDVEARDIDPQNSHSL